MDYGVKDSGVAINQLRYTKQIQSHNERFVGRKTMLNSFEDGLPDLDLIISKDSDVTTSSSVQFEIKDFNEKKVLSRHNQYDVTLTAVVSNWIVQSSIPSRPSKGGSTTVSKSSLFKNDDELIEYLLGKINNIYTI
jgi:hypothetical protein